MLFLFQGGSEYVKMDLDRPTKTLRMSTSKTGYNWKNARWKRLFDKGKETIQEMQTDKLNDDEFKAAITRSMAQLGYTLKKCQE